MAKLKFSDKSFKETKIGLPKNPILNSLMHFISFPLWTNVVLFIKEYHIDHDKKKSIMM